MLDHAMRGELTNVRLAIEVDGVDPDYRDCDFWGDTALIRSCVDFMVLVLISPSTWTSLALRRIHACRSILATGATLAQLAQCVTILSSFTLSEKEHE